MIPVSDAFRYMVSPRYLPVRTPLNEQSLRHLLNLLFVTLLLGIVSSGIVGGIVASAMGDLPENVNGALAETDPWQLFLVGVLFAPFFEELIFRSWLGLPRSSVLGLPALLCVIAILFAALSDEAGSLALVISFGLAGIYFLLARRFSALIDAEREVARSRLFPVAFWGSTLLFALVHISNFEGGMGAAFRTPVLFLAITPQLIAGAVLGYVRMRFGLIQAILFHALYNAVLIGIAVISVSLLESVTENTATALFPLLP